MQIASWNVNSIRSRLEHALEFLKTNEIDVLCLQELKCQDHEFPKEQFEELGYKCYVYGQKAYNGVAILTKYEPTSVEYGFKDQAFDEQKRIIKATIKGFDIYNIYLPNGNNPKDDKFIYKEGWFLRLHRMLKTEAGIDKNKVIVCGDYNVAPTNDDVLNPERSYGKVCFHPDEHIWFNKLIDLGMTDCFRLFNKTPKVFTWWDYRADSFKTNKGMRIDHFLTNDLANKDITNCYVVTEPRTWEKPSDHTPIIISIKD
jgi:exodeoxyribonuclease III